MAKLWDATTGQLLANLVGHEHTVLGADFSPDASTVATSSWDRSIKLWQVPSGRLIRTIEQEAPTLDVAFSPDGELLATCGTDRLVRLWDPSSGEPVAVMSGHTDRIDRIVFSPDGDYLVSAAWEKGIRIWAMPTGELESELVDESTDYFALAISPDSRTVAAGSRQGRVVLWDLASSRVKQVLEGHRESVQGLVFSPDGQALVSTGHWGEIQVWDLRTGRPRVTMKDRQGLGDLVVSTDGKTILTASAGGTIKFWDATTGTSFRTLKRHSCNVAALAFSPDGESLVAGCRDSGVMLWSFPAGKVTRHIPIRIDGRFAWLPGGGLLGTSSWGRRYRTWDVSAGRELFQGEVARGPVVMALSPHGEYMAYGGREKTVHVMDTKTKTERSAFEVPGSGVACLVFSPDSSRLACCGDASKVISIHQVNSGRQVGQLELPGRASAVAFSHDGRMAATAGYRDRRVWLWTTADGQLLRELHPPGPTTAPDETTAPDLASEGVLELAFSPDDALLASAGTGPEVRLWDTKTGTLAATLPHSSPVRALAFSPGGKLLATGALDPRILIWDTRTGKLRASLVGLDQEDWVTWTPEGSYNVSADGAQWVSWQTRTGVRALGELAVPRHAPRAVESALASP